jgi:hypothetical protein
MQAVHALKLESRQSQLTNERGVHGDPYFFDSFFSGLGTNFCLFLRPAVMMAVVKQKDGSANAVLQR